MKSLTQDQAAELAGLSARRLRQLAGDDDPPPVGAAGYPCAEFGVWLKRRNLEGIGFDVDGEICDYEAERARLTKAQADKAELELGKMKREMLPMQEVLEFWQMRLVAMRAKLLALPTKFAPLVIGLARLPLIEEQLRRGVHDALDEMMTEEIDGHKRDADSGAERDSAGKTAPRVGARRKNPPTTPDADTKPVGGHEAKAQRRRQR